MPEIRGRLDAGPDRPCVWCGELTPNLAEAPGYGLELPLHVFCAGAIIVAFRHARAGRLGPGQARLLARYQDRLAAGEA